MLISKRNDKITVLSILLLLIIGGLIAVLVTGARASPSQSREIPDEIAGYEVLFVKTKETTLCYPLDYPEITLRAKESSVDEFLGSSTSHSSVEKELKKLGFDEVGIAFAGPAITREQLIQLNDEWNANSRSSGCGPERRAWGEW
jgi:hypothetical protein